MTIDNTAARGARPTHHSEIVMGKHGEKRFPHFDPDKAGIANGAAEAEAETNFSNTSPIGPRNCCGG